MLASKNWGKCDGDGEANIRQRRDWSFDDFDAVEIRRSSSTKFDGAGVYMARVSMLMYLYYSNVI